MAPLLAILALVGLGACSNQRGPTCERLIDGLDKHLAAGRIVWFGEMHGTEESPRFIGDAVCLAAKRARVQLGLEVPHTEQALFDRYVQGKADRAALLRGPFWEQVDGRTSHAMVGLLDRVRALRKAGAKIELVLFDNPLDNRDEAMAQLVIQRRDAKAIFVGLSGNIHSRKQRWRELVPLVAHLIAAKLPVTTFNVSSNGGTFWGCVGTDDHEPVCGVHDNHDDGPGKPWTLGPARDNAHDGVYFVGKTTASPPARQR